mmetsp:Transcript_43613/g.68288  ORF Transcript_43613/g.68288 Transcript_43613/m.68288 type:complete len:234 (-) Transcript_43613:1085-1786(-)
MLLSKIVVNRLYRKKSKITHSQKSWFITIDLFQLNSRILSTFNDLSFSFFSTLYFVISSSVKGNNQLPIYLSSFKREFSIYSRIKNKHIDQRLGNKNFAFWNMIFWTVLKEKTFKNLPYFKSNVKKASADNRNYHLLTSWIKEKYLSAIKAWINIISKEVSFSLSNNLSQYLELAYYFRIYFFLSSGGLYFIAQIRTNSNVLGFSNFLFNSIQKMKINFADLIVFILFIGSTF